MTLAQEKLYEELSSIILNADSESPYLVAINGKDASGKTIMADSLAEYIKRATNREVIRISVDDFMNDRSVRYTSSESQGRGCYDYTFNFDAFKKYVLLPLQNNGSMTYKTKIFDHATDVPDISEDCVAASDSIVIVDGVFIFRNDLKDYWSLKILLDTNDEIVIERGAKRDQKRLGSYEVARQKYIDRYIASQKIYYSEEKPEESVDIVVDNNDFESPFIKE